MSEDSKTSLADRITMPLKDAVALNAGSASFSPSPAVATPAKDSWADEVASPTVAKGEETSLADAQVDGATEFLGGSSLHDAQYDVEVKLSDIQGDVNSPLHSISTFEEIGM
jgi:ATP-dependent RNA helicase DDX19/DBP5